ncbi:MAG: adgA nadE [Phycisphaerales bacterium]|nr:adgA nadE [Phycisphaerales bacterium]
MADSAIIPRIGGMRIALAQINPTVGDIVANTAKHMDFIARAKRQGATLVVFPELSLLGYPPKDLLLKSQFVADSLRALDDIARQVQGIDVIIGYADRNPAPIGRPLHNAVALLRDGRIHSRHFKTLLPTYDVFDESRYFEPGPINETENLVRIGDITAGLSICEDLWNDEKLIARRLYHQNPIADLNAAGAQLLINASASPFVVGKHDFRLQLFGEQVRRFNKPLVYVNQVGGNDELIFDGNSHVLDAQGKVIAQAKDFEEDLLVVDLEDAKQVSIHPHSVGLESIYKALVLGLRDYVRKCGFKTAVLGLSGGIDSALTAAIAADALGGAQVTGVAMPSRFSSEHSINDARALAANLGMPFHLVPIDALHGAYERTLYPVFDHVVAAISPGTTGKDPTRPDPAADLTDQNLQARVRGATLMAFSNRFNHLLLTTGNKSEIATGYCTLYGDMCGGLAVISDVPKTTVWALSRWINEHAKREIIPWSSIEKVPSAELKPNQTDQDSLPAYDVLDAILHRYIEEEKGVAEIVADGFDPATVNRVIKLIDRSEYKRRQAAPGLKVTSRAFGFGRRMPIAQNYVQTTP